MSNYAERLKAMSNYAEFHHLCQPLQGQNGLHTKLLQSPWDGAVEILY